MCARVDDDDTLREVLLSDPRLAPVLSDPERFRAQVLVSEEVFSGSDDVAPALVTRGFRAGAEYFYPASTIKLFVAVAACVEIQRLAKRHHPDAPRDASHPGRPLPRFRLGLDTEIAFERRGLVASVADSRAKTDAALRRRDRLIRLAEARLVAMERAEAETDASTETETEHPLMRRRPSTPPTPTRRSTSSPPRESPRTSSSTTAPPPPSPPSTRRSNPRTSPLPCLTTTRASLSPARVSERSRPASIPPPGRPSPTNFENCSSRRITRRIIDVTTSRGPRTRRRGRVARRTARGMKFA